MVLQHGNTSFLSLLPAIDRMLLIFEGLKSCFNSQEQCPLLINKFFEEPCGKLYLQFLFMLIK
jgi:hypothetical protein